MTDSKQIHQAPKLFCENIRLGYSPEYFVLALSSGAHAQNYALTPAHAKRLLQYLGHELEKYESEHGEVVAKWDPNIPSPLQQRKPPTEGS